MINRHAEADHILREAEALAPLVDDPITRANFSFLTGVRRNWLGRFDETLAILERWHPVAEASHSTMAIVLNQYAEDWLAARGRL